MANTKPISEWEKEKGKFLKDPSEVSAGKLTEKKFDDLTASPANWIGVDYDQRVKFLEDNGYKVTRENIIDPTLSVRENKDGKN